jgi:hypothetical protein
MKCAPLTVIVVFGLALLGCGSDVMLDDGSTCADWLKAPAFDQAEFVKQRRADISNLDSSTVARLVERRCQELVGISGAKDESIGPLIDDAVLTHQAYDSG